MEDRLSAQLSGLIRERAAEGAGKAHAGLPAFYLDAKLAADEIDAIYALRNAQDAASTGWDLQSWMNETEEILALSAYPAVRAPKSSAIGPSNPGAAVCRETAAAAAAKYFVEPQEVEDALSLSQLVLLYHPAVDLATGRIIELQAIPHWHHIQYGLIPLCDVDYGSDTHLTLRIARWGFLTAAAQLELWRRTHAGYASLGITAQVCSPLFEVCGALDKAAEWVASCALSPSCFSIHVDSAELLGGSRAGSNKVGAIHHAGFHTALTAFDGGVDAIAGIRKYPIRTVRFSEEFTRKVGRMQVEPSVSRAVIGLAKSMNLRVIGTGVESCAQLKRLRSFGCDIAQGDLFARPLSAQEIEPLLSQRAVFFQLVDSLSEMSEGNQI